MQKDREFWFKFHDLHYLEYKPRKYVVRKLIECLLFFACINIIFSYALSFRFHSEFMAWSSRVFAFVIVVAIIQNIRYTLRTGSWMKIWPIGWLQEIWKKDVCGHTFWFLTNGQGHYTVILTRRFEYPTFWQIQSVLPRPHHYIIPPVLVGIPLGGWFRWREKLVAYVDRNRNVRLMKSWRIKLIRVDPIQGPVINVRDHQGGRSWFMLSHFLKLLQESHQDEKGIPHGVLHSLFVMTTSRMLSGKNAHIETICSIIRQLDATKRFIKSKEAGRIRQRLIADLNNFLKSDDSRREEFWPTNEKKKTESNPPEGGENDE